MLLWHLIDSQTKTKLILLQWSGYQEKLELFVHPVPEPPPIGMSIDVEETLHEQTNRFMAQAKLREADVDH